MNLYRLLSKHLIYKNFIVIILLFLFNFFILNKTYSNNINKNESKDLIMDELKKVRERELSQRTYKLDRNQVLEDTEIVISPYELRYGTLPDWWSEKQSYDMSFLLAKALEQYPGLSIKISKNWDDILLEKELNKKPNNGLNENVRRIYIKPYIDDYVFNTLRPKKRGVGLIVIAVTKKNCITETFLSTNYKIKDITESNPKAFSKTIATKKLITRSTGGTSVNFNVGLAAFGGGDFKEPPKAQIKKIVYETVIDASEGIYCTLLNNKECVKYYKERKSESPSIEKRNRRSKKVIDKSC